MRSCRHCGMAVPAGSAIGRTTLCEGCGKPLHACCNCEYFERGAYHDCRESTDEYIEDKEAGNFCDYFVLAQGSDSPISDKQKKEAARAKAEALFNF